MNVLCAYIFFVKYHVLAFQIPHAIVLCIVVTFGIYILLKINSLVNPKVLNSLGVLHLSAHGDIYYYPRLLRIPSSL